MQLAWCRPRFALQPPCRPPQPPRTRCRAAHLYGRDAPHGARDPRYAEAHAAVDALLAAAKECEETRSAVSAAVVDSYVETVTFLGERLRLDRVVPSWNTGGFRGHAVAGRLREALTQPLSLPALSFGLVTQPAGRVTLDGDASRILKGAAAPGAAPDGYAVRSVFRLLREDSSVEEQGVNTVMGTFSLPEGDDEPREMHVQFTHVRVELTRVDGGVDEQVVALPNPARVTLRVLLMTPDVTVTRSSLGSLAVLTRRDKA